MARGQKPDYLVKLPVNGVWHKLGAAWNNDGGTINVVLDVGATMSLPAGTKLVLVPPKDDEVAG
jgi:hypothetical protein